MSENTHSLSISVFGMGYVGCVSAACLARDGHRVIGVDVSPVKLQALIEGNSPIKEPGLDELIKAAVSAGLLTATNDAESAIANTDVSLICVGTPSLSNGRLNLEYVESVARQIGDALKKRPPGHTVVMRSTMLPGTMAQLVRPALEDTSGHADGTHFFTAINPEFLRESSAIADYNSPPKIVIGTEHKEAETILKTLYKNISAPLIVTSTGVAEMVKYSDNVWHAAKIAFANEIGEICHTIGIDSHEVMDIFMQDTQLNISGNYLHPGFAFGGSCLPKDLRALTYFGRHHDLRIPLLQSVLESNEARIEDITTRILATGARRVGFYGLSFKRNTDDLRESPFVTLVERLLGKGLDIRIYDENIQLERLTGANKHYIDAHIPHLVKLIAGGFHAFDGFADLVVIGHRSQAAEEWVLRRDPEIQILDLARLPGLRGSPGYSGISW